MEAEGIFLCCMQIALDDEGSFMLAEDESDRVMLAGLSQKIKIASSWWHPTSLHACRLLWTMRGASCWWRMSRTE